MIMVNKDYQHGTVCLMSSPQHRCHHSASYYEHISFSDYFQTLFSEQFLFLLSRVTF